MVFVFNLVCFDHIFPLILTVMPLKKVLYILAFLNSYLLYFQPIECCFVILLNIGLNNVMPMKKVLDILFFNSYLLYFQATECCFVTLLNSVKQLLK